MAFVLLYYGGVGRRKTLKPTTLKNYIMAFRPMRLFANEMSISLEDVIRNDDLWVQFLRRPISTGDLTSISNVLSGIIRIPTELAGFEFVTPDRIGDLRKKISRAEPSKQFPVIPNRILSSFISQLFAFFDELESFEGKLFGLLAHLMADPCYGYTIAAQKKRGRTFCFRPTYTTAVEEYGLTEFLRKYNVSSLTEFAQFFGRVQHAGKMLLAFYTGMRRSEVNRLNIGCLKKDPEGYYMISGIVAKHRLIDEDQDWVAISDLAKPIRLLERLAAMLIDNAGQQDLEHPLFPSMVNADLYRSFAAMKDDVVRRRERTAHWDDVDGILDLNPFIIDAEDARFLTDVDPFRAWSEEPNFRVGDVWNFTPHQLKRSMAFYTMQSGLVSLPVLRKQMKHATDGMTMYYCQSGEWERGGDKANNDFGNYLLKVKPEADMVAYFRDVLSAEEPLFGAAGKQVKKVNSNDLSEIALLETRKRLVQDFKKGRKAYSETPLGACVSTELCTQRPSILVTSCLGCKSAIIKKDNLERVLSRQKRLVDSIDENSTDDFERRVETEELKNLENFKNVIDGV